MRMLMAPLCTFMSDLPPAVSQWNKSAWQLGEFSMNHNINNTGDDEWQQQPEDSLPNTNATSDATGDATQRVTDEPRRVRPQTVQIAWGALYLTFCDWIPHSSFFPEIIAPEMWLTFTAIGLGILLLAVVIIVGLGDRRRQPRS